jgi:WD40 repeat protein
MARVIAGMTVSILLLTVVDQGRSQSTNAPVFAPDKARLDQTLIGLDGPGNSIAAAGELLVVGCEEGTIQVWNKDVWMGVRNGRKAPLALQGHQGPVLALALRESKLASAGVDGKVILWDLSAGTKRQTLTPGGPPRCLALSPDDNVLAIGGEKNHIELWNLASGKPLGPLEGHTDWINCLTFNVDGKLLASGSHDGTVRVWDVPSRKQILSVTATPAPPANSPSPPINRVLAIALNPDSKQIALGGTDGLIHFANLADGKLIRALAGHTSSITGLAYHSDGKILASASKDRTVRLWDSTNGQTMKNLEGHTAWVQGVTFLDQGRRLASVSADRTVKVWDLMAK